MNSTASLASGQPEADSNELTFVKLGGSLITDKRRDAHARHDVIRGLAESLAAALPEMTESLVLGHGSGSYGHVAAVRHGFTREDGPSTMAAAHVAASARSLNGLIVDALLGAGVPAWTWAASTALGSRGGQRLSGELGSLEVSLRGGFLPVVYGDVILDTDRRAAIASTERIATFLQSRLGRRGWRMKRLLWLGETDGIWDASGKSIPRVDASNVSEVRRAVGGAAGTDVTGGMLLRLDTAWRLARRGVGSLIADGRRPGLLAAALRGEDVPGTLVVAE